MKIYNQGNQICLETLTNNEPFVEYWTVTYDADFILMGDFSTNKIFKMFELV